MISSGIDSSFPAARRIGYTLTSRITPDYNCIAWAAGDSSVPWWPPGDDYVYWPEEVSKEHSLKAFVEAFGTVRYKEWAGENSDLEEGFEKVAIYCDANGKPTHAARQLENGKWTSKLGRDVDIEHNSPAALETSVDGPTVYGNVAKILRRHREVAPQPII